MCLAIALALVVNAEKEQEKVYRDIFERVSKPEVYCKRIRPNLDSNSSLPVNVTLHVFNYHACSVKKQVELQMYFRQSWKDERLANDKEVTITNSQLADEIWVPDTFFSSAKKTEFIDQPIPNRFVRISPDGSVFLSKRYNLVLPCVGVNLGMQCDLEIESYGYSAKEIRYVKGKGDKSVGINEKAQQEDYSNVSANMSEKTETLSTGEYSILVVELKFDKTCKAN